MGHGSCSRLNGKGQTWRSEKVKIEALNLSYQRLALVERLRLWRRPILGFHWSGKISVSCVHMFLKNYSLRALSHMISVSYLERNNSLRDCHTRGACPSMSLDIPRQKVTDTKFVRVCQLVCNRPRKIIEYFKWILNIFISKMWDIDNLCKNCFHFLFSYSFLLWIKTSTKLAFSKNYKFSC